jgi:mono/diheme cytochrome c family protein
LAFACGGLPAVAQNAGSVVERGGYLFAAAGCGGCHTDTKNKGPVAAGGSPLKTPFGTFYGPNITPDPEFGIGKWSDADFIRALREGVDPDAGEHFFPAFPYTSFTLMTDEDLKAIKAYIFTLKPVAKPSRPHEVGFPFNLRFLQLFWKWLFFEEGPFNPEPSKSPEWNRGAYLVRAVAHCGECHTPRNRLGGLEKDRRFAGTDSGPEGESVPNITPDPQSGIGKWSAGDVASYLATGLDPEGDVAGSLMADVIERSTGKLTDADRAAIVVYLKSLPPIRAVGRKKAGK